MGNNKFIPLQNRYPLTHCQQTVTCRHVGDPYTCAKFRANPSMGMLCKQVKYNGKYIYLFKYTPFSGTYLQVRRVDRLLRSMAQQRGLTQGCAFWGLVDIADHFGSRIHQTPILGVCMGIFKPNAQNNKTYIKIQNYCTNFHQILIYFSPSFAR